MADLLFQHVGHPVGRGPHALADLGLARQAALQADGDVARLIGRDPVAGLDVGLAHHRTGLHGRVDLVASAIEEAGVDEDDPVLHRVDAGGEIGGCAAFLVHHADLDRVAGQGQQILDGVEQPVGESGLVGAVHLRLDDIDGSRGAVAEAAQPFDVIESDQAGDDRVHDPLGRLGPVGQQDGGRRHQMADVAHEQQTAALQGHGRAVGGRPVAVRLKRARQGLAALPEGRRQVAAHQAQPVAIGLDLVGGVDGRDRVFQIDDGGQGRFQHHVRQARRIGATNRVGPVDHQFDMQAVVRQQDRRRGGCVADEADELGRIGESGDQGAVDHRPAGDIRVGAGGQARGLVQESLGARHHAGAARRVIAAADRKVPHGVSAVEGVVQAAPAGVGGVQQEAGVQHRHHQLRSRHPGDLRIHPVRADEEGFRFRNQIADLAQEGLGRRRVVGPALPGAVPGVDPGLKIVPGRQQGAVLGRETGQQVRRSAPEGRGVQAQIRQHRLFDQGREFGRDLQPGAIFIGRHGGLSPARRPGL